MTDYLVKSRFRLRRWGNMTINADAIAVAPQLSRERMFATGFPESVEADQRREG